MFVLGGGREGVVGGIKYPAPTLSCIRLASSVSSSSDDVKKPSLVYVKDPVQFKKEKDADPVDVCLRRNSASVWN